MKFTSGDLLRVLGLKVGDVIKTSVGDIFEIVEVNFIYLYLKNAEGRAIAWQSNYLIDLEFEILPPVKKVGDMRCKDFEVCKECPLRFINCRNSDNQVLFDIFKDLKENLCLVDEEIEAIIEKRLNKEVK